MRNALWRFDAPVHGKPQTPDSSASTSGVHGTSGDYRNTPLQSASPHFTWHCPLACRQTDIQPFLLPFFWRVSASDNAQYACLRLRVRHSQGRWEVGIHMNDFNSPIFLRGPSEINWASLRVIFVGSMDQYGNSFRRAKALQKLGADVLVIPKMPDSSRRWARLFVRAMNREG